MRVFNCAFIEQSCLICMQSLQPIRLWTDQNRGQETDLVQALAIRGNPFGSNGSHRPVAALKGRIDELSEKHFEVRNYLGTKFALFLAPSEGYVRVPLGRFASQIAMSAPCDLHSSLHVARMRCSDVFMPQSESLRDQGW
jgi:hypothetical protein